MTFCGKYILIYCKDASPSRINNCWATPRHGQDTVANRSRWDGCHPLLLQCLGQLTHMCMQEQWIEAPLVLHVQDALNVHDTLLKPCIHSSSSFWLPLVLCFNTTTPDVMQPATLRSFLPVTATMSGLVPGFLSCPIQQVWNELDRRVWGRVNEPAHLHEQLFQALQEWMTVPKQVIRNLIQSMPTRCPPVTDSRRSTTPNICMALSCKILTNWTDFNGLGFECWSRELNQLKNEIWLTFLFETF